MTAAPAAAVQVRRGARRRLRALRRKHNSVKDTSKPGNGAITSSSSSCTCMNGSLESSISCTSALKKRFWNRRKTHAAPAAEAALFYCSVARTRRRPARPRRLPAKPTESCTVRTHADHRMQIRSTCRSAASSRRSCGRSGTASRRPQPCTWPAARRRSPRRTSRGCTAAASRTSP